MFLIVALGLALLSFARSAQAASPSARLFHVMTSPGGDRELLFGGSTGGDETWLASGFYGGLWYRAYLPVVVRNR